jgi:hypothetical protein
MLNFSHTDAAVRDGKSDRQEYEVALDIANILAVPH